MQVETAGMEDVVEYDFSTDPEWVSEAIDFTEVGLELNFKKLSALCGRCKLPNKISILLAGANNKTDSRDKMENSEYILPARKYHRREI